MIPATIAGAAVLALAAAGCGSNSSDSSGGSGTGSGSGSGGEKVLTIATANDITGVDPAYVIDDQTHELVTNIYDVGIGLGEERTAAGLVRSSARPVPEAFDRWTKSDDGLTYRFHVREGMTFHDGSPVTPDDVAFSYNRLLGTNSGGRWAMNNIIKNSKPVRVEGQYVVMHTDAPSVLATQMLFADTFAILDREDVEKHATKDDPWAERWLAKNIGNASGPYMLESHVKDQELVLRAYDGYWAGKPAYDRVVWKIVPSGAERLSLLKAGVVDMAMGLTPQQIASLKGTEGITISDGPTYRETAIGMHNDMAPFDDVKVRQAVSYGIDYQDIIDNVYEGSAVRSAGPVPAGSPFAVPDDWAYQYDPEKAKALLREAGYDGTPVRLAYNNDNAANQDVVVRVKDQLSQIGMKVELVPYNNAVYDEKFGRKEFQMWIRDLLAWIPDPDYIFDLFFKCENLFNYVNYCDRDVDRAIDVGWGIFDHDERYELFSAAQRRMIDAAPWVFISQANFQVAMRDDVTGFITPQNLIPVYKHLRPAS